MAEPNGQSCIGVSSLSWLEQRDRNNRYRAGHSAQWDGALWRMCRVSLLVHEEHYHREYNAIDSATRMHPMPDSY